MENVSLKLEKGIARQIETAMKEFMYSTKTEFIRAAIREKLNRLERERAIKRLYSLKGKAGKEISDSELRNAREQLSKELEETI